MKKSILLMALLAATTSAFGITGDWIEDTAHPYVGLVAFYDAKGSFVHRCSGSLINKTKLVTAGHCTDATSGAVSARVWFQQDAGAHFVPPNGEDPFTGYPNQCAAGTLGTLCATSAPNGLRNYGFDNFAGFPNTHDVGVVILEQEITPAKYGSLPEAGTLEGVTAHGRKNTLFTVSGYGLTLSVNVHTKLSNVSFRERLMASSSLVDFDRNQWTNGYNLQTQGNGNSRGGTCSGDSGGPVFLGGSNSNLIVAVTSFGRGNEMCRGTDFSYRIDRQEVLDWINSQ
jgi:secreted trypsin-like serine protease